MIDPAEPRTGVDAERHNRDGGTGDRSVLGEAALRISRRLVGSALWWNDCCNWQCLAWEHDSDQLLPSVRTLTPELYGGASGVGLFLAEAARETGCALTQRTAQSALRTAVAAAGDVPHEVRFGMYSGLPGIAYALVRSGDVLQDEELRAHGIAILRQLFDQCDVATESEFDVMSGLAGCITSILSLPQDLRHEFIERGVSCAERLLVLAERRDDMMSWRSPSRDGVPHPTKNLTGFSHGGAGVAYALAGIATVTREARYEAAARSTVRYERSVFSQTRSNWPDYRGTLGSPGGEHERFSTAWCNGSPGILLARYATDALRLARDDVEHTDMALEAVTQHVSAVMKRGVTDWSLCHGLLGISELLLVPAVFNRRSFECELIACLAEGCRIRLARDEVWECGTTGGGEVPGLMGGLAGIGLQLLRLSRPRVVSSILIPGSPRYDAVGQGGA